MTRCFLDAGILAIVALIVVLFCGGLVAFWESMLQKRRSHGDLCIQALQGARLCRKLRCALSESTVLSLTVLSVLTLLSLDAVGALVCSLTTALSLLFSLSGQKYLKKLLLCEICLALTPCRLLDANAYFMSMLCAVAKCCILLCQSILQKLDMELTEPTEPSNTLLHTS